jgi:hypothetical protein
MESGLFKRVKKGKNVFIGELLFRAKNIVRASCDYELQKAYIRLAYLKGKALVLDGLLVFFERVAKDD